MYICIQLNINDLSVIYSLFVGYIQSTFDLYIVDYSVKYK